MMHHAGRHLQDLMEIVDVSWICRRGHLSSRHGEKDKKRSVVVVWKYTDTHWNSTNILPEKDCPQTLYTPERKLPWGTVQTVHGTHNLTQGKTFITLKDTGQTVSNKWKSDGKWFSSTSVAEEVSKISTYKT